MHNVVVDTNENLREVDVSVLAFFIQCDGSSLCPFLSIFTLMTGKIG